MATDDWRAQMLNLAQQGSLPAPPLTTVIAPQPLSTGVHTAPSFDMIELLPPGGAEKMRLLRQRDADLHAVKVPHAELQEARTAKVAAAQRLKRLTDHRSAGGFELADDDARVIAARRELERLDAEDKRLNDRSEMRAAAWRAAGQVRQAVETWLRDGRPRGTMLEDYETEVPKLAKGETVLDAIERIRGAAAS